jgi:HD-GYP domain-containing protein (c-di-GMP phosphodiesterase class II)
VATLFGTLKLAEMYGVRHDAAQRALENLSWTVREAAGGAGEVFVSLRGQRLQVNEKTMRASQCGALAVAYITEQWARRNLATVRIRADVAPRDLAGFTEVFHGIGDTKDKDPAGRLTAELLAAGVTSITVERREESHHEALILEDHRQNSMRAYIRGLSAFKAVLRQDGFEDRRKIRRARRAVQGLVDSFLENEATVLTLAQIHGHDVKLFHHCLGVCIYSVAMGQRLGMSRRQLGELGLAALFHDLGKTASVEAEEEESGGCATEQALEENPARGARMLLDEGPGHEGMLKAAVVAYEQRMHFEGGDDPHLFSRIIAIADCYEALSCRRESGDPHYSTYAAFRLMQAKSGTIFDPLLLKVFAQALGIYPIGSVVELASGEIAVVTDAPSDAAQIDLPTVRILKSAGHGLQRGDVVDLSEPGEDGKSRAAIRRTLPPESVFTSLSDLVAAV